MSENANSGAHLDQNAVLEMFERTGALLRGHFLLTSGLHSSTYLQCARVLQHPENAEALGRALAAHFSDLQPTCVVAPAIGGIVIGHEVGRALGVRAIFTEREERAMRLRRGFELSSDDRVLVVEDVITTGGSTRETIEAVAATGASVVGAGSIIDRSGGAADVGVARAALATLSVEAYEPEACPMCQEGTPAVKPGSRK